MWLAYVPWSRIYPVCIASYVSSWYFCSSGFQSPVLFVEGVGMFSSFWFPLALAEVTSYPHFTTDTSTVINGVQVIKKHIDKVFIASCMVTNIVRNALWVTQLKKSMDFMIVSVFHHLCLILEGVTLLVILRTGRLNLATYQNQEKVNVSPLGFRLAYHPIN